MIWRLTLKRNDPKKQIVRTRNLHIKALILGSVKGGPHKDQKKEQSRKACRAKVRTDD